MTKHIGILVAAALLLMFTTENECWAQGFGGFHGGAVRAGGARGAHNVGRNVGRVGGVGYNRGVGGNVYSGIPAGAIRSGNRYGGNRYGGYGYGGYGNGDTYILPPNPGKGPAGIESIGKLNPGGNDLAASDLDKLTQSLNQMRLPSDAGMPPTKGTNDGSKGTDDGASKKK